MTLFFFFCVEKKGQMILLCPDTAMKHDPCMVKSESWLWLHQCWQITKSHFEKQNRTNLSSIFQDLSSVFLVEPKYLNNYSEIRHQWYKDLSIFHIIIFCTTSSQMWFLNLPQGSSHKLMSKTPQESNGKMDK